MSFKKRMRLRDRYALWDLDSARHAYWNNNDEKAGRLLHAVWRTIVIEPHPDSEEYKNEQEKAFAEESEPEPDETGFEGNTPDFLNLDDYDADLDPEYAPDRDDQGYLIR